VAMATLHGDQLDEQSIQMKAYELWQLRGCPDGSPEEDWYEAVRLVGQLSTGKTRSSEQFAATPHEPVKSAAGARASEQSTAASYEAASYESETGSELDQPGGHEEAAPSPKKNHRSRRG
jgi:hypothetical protein